MSLDTRDLEWITTDINGKMIHGFDFNSKYILWLNSDQQINGRVLYDWSLENAISYNLKLESSSRYQWYLKFVLYQNHF